MSRCHFDRFANAVRCIFSIFKVFPSYMMNLMREFVQKLGQSQ
ncbi:hypothetical protein EFW58_01884 [Bacillus velezensis]|nr:hypothetical protein EFW58_01884 [Bacillus velezensis]